MLLGQVSDFLHNIARQSVFDSFDREDVATLIDGIKTNFTYISQLPPDVFAKIAKFMTFLSEVWIKKFYAYGLHASNFSPSPVKRWPLSLLRTAMA